MALFRIFRGQPKPAYTPVENSATAKKEEKNLELIERNNLSINALVDETKKELEKAKNLHKQVENYYIDSMNFDGINEVSKKLIERIV